MSEPIVSAEEVRRQVSALFRDFLTAPRFAGSRCSHIPNSICTPGREGSESSRRAREAREGRTDGVEDKRGTREHQQLPGARDSRARFSVPRVGVRRTSPQAPRGRRECDVCRGISAGG